MTYKNLTYILAGYIITLNSIVFAGDDITKSNYMIDLGKMDPVGVDHGGSGGMIPSGKGALLAVLEKFSEILLFMIPLIAAVSFIIAGYFYIFSSGDAEKANQGKTIIKWNIVAILVAFSAYTLIKIVASFFS